MAEEVLNEAITDSKTLVEQYIQELNNTPMVEIMDQIDDQIPLNELLSQIKNTFSSNVPTSPSDLFEYFIKRYRYARTELEGNQDAINDLDDTIKDISIQVINAISELFEFNINFDNPSADDMIEYTHAIYDFFILNYSKNFQVLGFEYIKNNMDALVTTISSYDHRQYEKNLSYESLKTQIDNKYTPVIYFLSDTLDNMVIDGKELIETIINTDPEEYTYDLIGQIFIDAEDQDGLPDFSVSFVNNISEFILGNPLIYQTIRGSLITYYRNLNVEEKKED